MIDVSRNAVFTAIFLYDGDGNRVKSTINGVTTILPCTQDRLFIGNWFEWHTDANDKVRYYDAGGQRIAMRTGNNVPTSNLTYLFGDHLGSTSLTYKADTGATTTQLYSPWGEVRYSSGTLPTKYTFTGQYSYAGSGEFGLLFYVARFYDPVLGRFSSPDTLVPGAGNPMAWDRYAYVLNSPMSNVDPSGHRTCTAEQAATGDETCDQNIPTPVVNFDEFGIEPDDLDPLVYELYNNPSSFDFEISATFPEYIHPYLIMLICGLIGQGCVFGQGDMVFDLYEIQDGSVWNRGIEYPNGDVLPLFYASWTTSTWNGETVAKETFYLQTLNTTASVFLAPSIQDGSLIWDAVAMDMGRTPKVGLPFPLINIQFVTTQIGENTILTTGTASWNGVWLGTITLNGSYKGP